MLKLAAFSFDPSANLLSIILFFKHNVPMFIFLTKGDVLLILCSINEFRHDFHDCSIAIDGHVFHVKTLCVVQPFHHVQPEIFDTSGNCFRLVRTINDNALSYSL